ncbi:carbohydrate kinase [soil metagenome]
MLKADVVAFGEILWEVYEAERARAGEPIARLFRRELGGAPANFSVDLARIGVRAAVIGGVGRDAFGVALEQALAREGVLTEGLVRLPSRTGLAFVRRDEHGEPSFLFYRHETADMMVRARDLAPFRARWALVGTSTMLDPGLADATRAFLRHARRGGASVVVDLNVRVHLWKSRTVMRARIQELLRHADVVKASAPDLAAVGGETFLRKHARGATWILTDGAALARAKGAFGEVSVPAKPVKCVDATGAGDAFIAGVLAALLAANASPGTKAYGDPQVFAAALAVGHKLGAKAVSRPGAVAGLVGLGAVKAALKRLRSAK